MGQRVRFDRNLGLHRNSTRRTDRYMIRESISDTDVAMSNISKMILTRNHGKLAACFIRTHELYVLEYRAFAGFHQTHLMLATGNTEAAVHWMSTYAGCIVKKSTIPFPEQRSVGQIYEGPSFNIPIMTDCKLIGVNPASIIPAF